MTLAKLQNRDTKAIPVLGINRRNLDLVFPGYRPGRFRVLDDKLMAKERLSAVGLRVPRTLALVSSHRDLASLAELLRQHSEIVVKPVNGYGGKGILVLTRDGDGWHTPSGECLEFHDLTAHLADILTGVFSMDESGDQALIEERLHPHEFCSQFYPEGLADIRIVLENGEPMQAMCRLPTAASDGKANLHSGGVGLGVDLKTGLTTGGICAGKAIDRHPDTGAPLVGQQIPDWQRCLEVARSASSVVEVDYLGVDIVLDRDQGPVILEINARPGLAIQIANGKPQPVSVRKMSSPWDRFTMGCAWLLFAAFVFSPFIYDSGASASRPVEILTLPGVVTTTPAAADEAVEGSHSKGEEWSDEAIPVSDVDERFKSAREAVAATDTASALELYRAAATDSGVAPFALNNIALIQRAGGELVAARETLKEAVRRYPTYERGYYNLGLVLRDLGELDKALHAFRTTLHLRPSHARSWAGVGGILFDLGQHEAAAEAYEKAVQYKPDAKGYRRQLGLLYRLLGRREQAVARFAEVLALDPENESATYWWARSLVEMRREAPGNGVEPDSIIARLAPFVSGSTSSGRCAAISTDLDWEQGRWEQAMDACSRLVQMGERRAFHAQARAAIAVDLGLWSEASKWLAELQDQSSDFASAQLELVQMGMELEFRGPNSHEGVGSNTALETKSFDNPALEIVRLAWLGDLPTARKRLTQWTPKSRDIEPDLLAWLVNSASHEGAFHLDVLELVARSATPSSLENRLENTQVVPKTLLLWLVHRFAVIRGQEQLAARALSVLEAERQDYYPLQRQLFFRNAHNPQTRISQRLGQKLLERAPHDEGVIVELASLYAGDGDARRARALYKRLLRRQRNQIPARILEARILAAEGKAGKGARILRQVVKKNPDNLAAKVALSEIEFATGRTKQAIAGMRAALELAPGRLDIRRQFAHHLMQSKHYDRAAAEWRRLLHLQGDMSLFDRFDLALCLQRDGRNSEAIEEYDHILRADDERTKAWFNRSLALEKLGRLAEAREGYERVLKLDPNHNSSRKKLTCLGGLGHADLPQNP